MTTGLGPTQVAQIPSVERLADRLYHDAGCPSEVLAVRQEVRRLAERVVAPVAHELANQDEREDGFPDAVFKQLGEGNLFRIPFQKDVGGFGLEHRATATATALEELAYYSNSVAAIFDVHCILAGNALDRGTPEQRQRWLAPIVDGSIVAAFATSEPGASSDLSPAAVQTVAVQDNDHWVLDGRKRWITNSIAAGVIVVLARTEDQLTTFIVPTDRPGVTICTPDRKLGNRAQITADVILEDVHLDDSLVLGEPGRGLTLALQTLTSGRIGIAAAGVGMTQAAFDRTAAHLATRSAFGGLLGAKQHWQFLMARRATQLESARSLYLKAAMRPDEGQPFPEPEAALAKLIGTELAVDMARDAVQAFGGLGFTFERGADGLPGPVEAFYRDSKIGEIYEGANEVQQWVIARQIFGGDITG